MLALEKREYLSKIYVDFSKAPMHVRHILFLFRLRFSLRFPKKLNGLWPWWPIHDCPTVAECEPLVKLTIGENSSTLLKTSLGIWSSFTCSSLPEVTKLPLPYKQKIFRYSIYTKNYFRVKTNTFNIHVRDDNKNREVDCIYKKYNPSLHSWKHEALEQKVIINIRNAQLERSLQAN